MKKIICLVLLMASLFTVSLCGCSDYVPKKSDFSAGEPVTPEQIKLISESLAGELTVTEAPTETEEVTVFVIDENTVYYWTKSGSKLHLYGDCPSFRETSVISSGTLEEGVAAKKSGICDKCSKRAGLDGGKDE